MQLIMRSSAAILERCSSPMYFRFGSDTAEQRAKISVRFAAKQSKSRRSAFGRPNSGRCTSIAIRSQLDQDRTLEGRLTADTGAPENRSFLGAGAVVEKSQRYQGTSDSIS